jgi:hypothetical protein
MLLWWVTKKVAFSISSAIEAVHKCIVVRRRATGTFEYTNRLAKSRPLRRTMRKRHCRFCLSIRFASTLQYATVHIEHSRFIIDPGRLQSFNASYKTRRKPSRDGHGPPLTLVSPTLFRPSRRGFSLYPLDFYFLATPT